jgi:hypothetical protein
MIRSLIIFFLLMFLTGCEIINDLHPTAMFEVQYINYAWGYQHSGLIIDASGEVREFDLPSVWNYPDSAGYISEADMEENLAQLGEKLCTVSKRDLSNNSDKLANAQKGKLTVPEHQMCDFGSLSYSGYIYEPGKNRYKYVLIRKTGDFYVENVSRDASEIYDWLTSPCENNLSVTLR